MDYDYLFYQELPKGIKSVYVNGKRLSIEEFKKAKSDFLSKRNSKIKSSTVLNFCKIDNKYIKYFLDTTPTKAGKYTPGTHILIKKYKGIPNDVDYAFLGAWNFKDEIFKKEKAFRKRGGKFITHVPSPRII